MDMKKAMLKLSPLLESTDIETVMQGLSLWESLFDGEDFIDAFEHFSHQTTSNLFTLFAKNTFLPNLYHSRYITYWFVFQLYGFEKVRSVIEPITTMKLIFEIDFPDLPDGMFNLKDLQTLTIYNVQHCKSLAALNNLPVLERLNIMNGDLRGKSDLIGELPSLRVLSFINTKMQYIPTSICSFQNLKELNLTNNHISKVPPEIGNLTNLEYLYLNFDRHSWHSERITKLPDSITKLTKLKHLNLSGHKLSSLPENFGNMQQLVYLKMPSQKLTVLPESFSRCTRLQYLNVHNCKLVSLPSNIGELQELHTFMISRNQLTSLPDSICQLSQISDWDLQNNRLTSLPVEFGKLPLRRVLLKNNALESLPESLGQCSTLENLDVSQNRLNTLPDWLCSMKNAATVDWQKNRLQQVPNGWNPEQNPNINVDHNKMFFKPTYFWGMYPVQKYRLFSSWCDHFSYYEESPWMEKHPHDKQLQAFVNSFIKAYKTQQMMYVAKRGSTRRQFTTSERKYVEGSWWPRKRRRTTPIEDPNLTDMRDLFAYRLKDRKKLTTRDLHQSVRDQIAFEYGSRLIPFTPSLINRITRIMFHMMIPFAMDPLLLNKSGICIRNFGTFRGIKAGKRTFLNFRVSSNMNTKSTSKELWSHYKDEFEYAKQVNSGQTSMEVMNLQDLRWLVYWSLVYSGYKWHNCINVSKEFVGKIFTLIFDIQYGIIPTYLGDNSNNQVRIKGLGTLSINKKDNSLVFTMGKSLIKIEK